jgi:hypothetical protein
MQKIGEKFKKYDKMYSITIFHKNKICFHLNSKIKIVES